MKKSLLELGGSDAFIVLAGADLDAAVATGIKARFQNAGQVYGRELSHFGVHEFVNAPTVWIHN